MKINQSKYFKNMFIRDLFFENQGNNLFQKDFDNKVQS